MRAITEGTNFKISLGLLLTFLPAMAWIILQWASLRELPAKNKALEAKVAKLIHASYMLCLASQPRNYDLDCNEETGAVKLVRRGRSAPVRLRMKVAPK